MLIWLTEYLTQFDSGFGVFKYLTLRTILSVLTSLFISFILGHYLINHLTSKQITQSVRDYGPEAHLKTLIEMYNGNVIHQISELNAQIRPNHKTPFCNRLL